MKSLIWKPETYTTNNRWVVIVSLLAGLVFDSINWPMPWGIVIPDITPVILIYWVMALTHSNFLLTAFVFGLFHDVLYHTGLGAYALIYLVMVYPMLHFRLQIRNKSLLQMSLFIGLWMLMHQSLVWLLTPAKNITQDQTPFWLASLIAVLLWPPFYLGLRAIRRRFHVR